MTSALEEEKGRNRDQRKHLISPGAMDRTEKASIASPNRAGAPRDARQGKAEDEAGRGHLLLGRGSGRQVVVEGIRRTLLDLGGKSCRGVVLRRDHLVLAARLTEMRRARPLVR